MRATEDPNAAPASESRARDPRDPAWFRQVLGHYPTGVSVVTGIAADGRPAGLVVGSFTSVSLHPPLIAFLPDRSSSSWPKILAGGRFCVNLLAHDQGDLCRRFSARGGEKFSGVSWRPAGSGSPVLEGVVAWIDCELESAQGAGDHFLVIGRVLELDIEQPLDPLLFFRGGYGRFAPLSLISGDIQMREELRLADRARPQMEALARDLRAQCVAWAMVDEDLVLLASAGEPERPGVPARMIGARLPVRPPVGATWVAFEPPERVERWLARAPAGERKRHAELLSLVRDRGHAIWGSGPARPIDLREGPVSEVETVTVPVFGSGGGVELLLGLHGFAGLEDEAELARYVSRLRRAAGEIIAVSPGVGG